MRACSSAAFATRRSRLENRSSSTRAASPIASNTPRANASVGAQRATWPSFVSKIPNGASRGTTFPVRISIPARSIVSHGSVATSEVSAPRRPTSTCWPRPVRSRMKSAESVPMTPKSGPTRSPNGTALRTGGSPWLPGVIIRPESAWKIVSMPLPGSPAPKPLIER